MSAKHMNQEETAKRLSTFQPARSKGTMAAVLLFGLASLFMTGCGHKKVPAPKPATATPIGAIPMVEIMTGSGIKVDTKTDKTGKTYITMTEEAKRYLHLYNKTGFSVKKHTEVRRKLGDVCKKLAKLPAENIRMMAAGTIMDTRLEMIRTSYEEARKKAATTCTYGHDHGKDGHKKPSKTDIFKGLNLNKH